MLRRWYAISASRSNGRKRKSDIIFVTSKSKKVGRASDMNAVPVWGSLDYCALHNDRYIGRCSGGVKGFFAPQQFRRELVARRSVGRAPIRTILRSCAAEHRAPPWFGQDPVHRRAARRAWRKDRLQQPA